MSDLWLTVGVPATVGVATALYATGGRGALARRAIKQDLEIAKLLPEGTARKVLERVAEEKAIIYGSRWVGPQALTRRGHMYLAGTAVVGAAMTWGAARFVDDAAGHLWAASVLVLAMLAGLTGLALAIALWGSLMVTADNARTRASTVEVRRARVEAFVRDREAP
ncbi:MULTISPECIES: hypothetical protein [unclassified Nocardioides]|uniref:hypothetical protein n=1 Tax=unclassified Nocardioides TaxID=2615069 RepID=UPI0012E3C8F8|nr:MULTISPECIES: hypothetical protein [unclassified Nocardioides]